MTGGLSPRENAAPTQGAHVAGVNDEFSDAVNSDHPRCPSCQALWADGEDRGMCPSCLQDYREAEERSRRRAEKGIIGSDSP